MDESTKILAGRYELGETIGRGGMAEVHIGHDRRLSRTVAIKVLRADLARDPSFLNRFRREAQAAAALNHPSIVAVYDTGEEVVTEPSGAQQHVPFIVMEYVEGHTVRDMLRSGSALPLEETLEITAGVLAALEYSHQAGIVHRDIKPANVMMTPAGTVKVMDFGIARALADSAATMTQTQAVVGTAQYLSPEQARGEQVDARTDLYSTGCLLFEMLTGRPPFVADSMVAVAYQHVREEAPLPSSLSPGLPEAADRIVHKSLAKDRDARYQTAADFRADIEALARGGRVLAPPVGVTAPTMAVGTQLLAPAQDATAVLPPAQPPAPWEATGLDGLSEEEEAPRSRRGWIIALSVVAVLAVGGIVWFLLSHGRSSLVAVPDVTGKSEAVASATLSNDGFVPMKKEEASSTVAAGTVTRTDPASGQKVAHGSQVDYYVSTGPGSVQVPTVAGQTPDRAAATLKAAGLAVAVTQVPDDNPGFPAGQVTKTSPAAGESATAGQEITLYVSTGRVQLPTLTGMTQDAATQAIAALKLNSKIVPQQSADQAAGTVLSQDPAPGLVNQGIVVTITVAQAPPTGLIPAVANLSYDAAVAQLNAVGFTNIVRGTDAPSDTVAAGKVISVNPAAGQTVPLTQRITLTVSTGPQSTPTPTSPSVTPTKTG